MNTRIGWDEIKEEPKAFPLLYLVIRRIDERAELAINGKLSEQKVNTGAGKCLILHPWQVIAVAWL